MAPGKTISRTAAPVVDRRIDSGAQEAALMKLLNVLERACPGGSVAAHAAYRASDPYSRLARLRAAHAAYALATMSGIERMSEGAYLRA